MPTSEKNPITQRSLDQLEGALISLSHRINASEYDFLVLIREFDIRQGWKAWHFNNCAEWLNMKCGISLGAAREKVRVANGLFNLPRCSEAFASGELSYSKARALTRIANPVNEQALLEYAKPATASQVEDHCRQLRNIQSKLSTPDANRVHHARYLSCTRHDDGSMNINMALPRETGELVMKAIEMAMATNDSEQTKPEYLDEDESDIDTDIDTHINSENQNQSQYQSTQDFFKHQADAMVNIAKSYLGGNLSRSSTTADHYQVMLHVDESALLAREGDGERTEAQAGKQAKSDLPIESIRRITCDVGIIAITEDAKGNPLNVGRKLRVVSTPLKRALLGRDRCCRFPGCSHDRWLDAHHVMHWAEGGETSLVNTLLLCSKHHRLLHEGGFSIHKNFEGAWYFRNNTGKILPEVNGYRSTLSLDPSRDGLLTLDSLTVNDDIDGVHETRPTYIYPRGSCN